MLRSENVILIITGVSNKINNPASPYRHYRHINLVPAIFAKHLKGTGQRELFRGHSAFFFNSLFTSLDMKPKAFDQRFSPVVFIEGLGTIDKRKVAGWREDGSAGAIHIKVTGWIK